MNYKIKTEKRSKLIILQEVKVSNKKNLFLKTSLGSYNLDFFCKNIYEEKYM